MPPSALGTWSRRLRTWFSRALISASASLLSWFRRRRTVTVLTLERLELSM